ncbi:hypothetical protein Clacol_003452 [Clathrus columnatus]|uniref:VIT domain-containing protein n=1 Tax=Clathrus columnatus TaxID=1419009 RepID=A0AAV5A8D5_9AGAM|nr:hypothetical protein Clacol_003452 [Clathrus columnatus]
MASSQPPCSGIVYNDGKTWLPLVNLDVNVSIIDISSQIILSQTYFYDGPHLLMDAYYMFPLPPTAAVCGFEMKTNDGTSLEGVVKKVSDARQDYDDAVQDGKLASLLEQFRHDIFVLSLGSFFPQTEIQISISFVMDLSDNDEDDSVRFQLPAYVSHRFGVPPTSKLYHLTGTSHLAGLSINLDIQMSGEILDVRSNYNLEDIPVTSSDSFHMVRKQFKSPGKVLHDDFLLIIQAIGLDQPRCFVETWGRTAGLSLSLVPQFNSPNVSIPASEYIFLIDHSGSMSLDNKMYQTKQALDILLRSLPQGANTWFNVYQFDHCCQGLWTRSCPFNGTTLQQAVEGGTNILSAICTAFRSRLANIPTNVFVLTDGEVYNTDECIAAVRTAVRTASPNSPIRVFSLAFGHSASMALCEGIAIAGNGFCSSALEGDQLMKKCVTLLNGMMSNNVRNLRIDWGVDGSTRIQQTPHDVNLFSKKRLTVSAIIPNDEIPSVVTISGTFPDGSSLNHRVPIEPVQTNHLLPLIDSRLQKLYRRPLLHTLTAHRLILDLERNISPQFVIPNWATLTPSSRNVAIEREIVSLGVKYHLASSQTAFIAVDKPPSPPPPPPVPPPSGNGQSATRGSPAASSQGTLRGNQGQQRNGQHNSSSSSSNASATTAQRSKNGPSGSGSSSPSQQSRTESTPSSMSTASPASTRDSFGTASQGSSSPSSSPPFMPGGFSTSPVPIIETHPDPNPDVLYFFGGNVPDAIFMAPPLPLTKVFFMPLRKITSIVSRKFPNLGARMNQATRGIAGNIWNNLFPADQSVEFNKKLTEWARFQNYDGSFTDLQGLCNFIGCNSADIPTDVIFPDSVTIDQKTIWETALAIEYLRRRYPQNWLRWKDLVRKSMVWGEATCGSLEAFEGIMKQACLLF